MAWYVLTGTPGAGKTAILRQLERDGLSVVEEAATDVIALEQAHGRPEPWERPEFTDVIARLQHQRELAAPADRLVIFDRSPVCTLALCRYSGRLPSAALTAQVEQLITGRVYEPEVFFVRSQGYVVPTAARRISQADAMRFEALHEQVYRELGYRLIEVPPDPLASRAALVRDTVAALATARTS